MSSLSLSPESGRPNDDQQLKRLQARTNQFAVRGKGSTDPVATTGPGFCRKRSNQAMIALALAAACEGRAAIPPWLAPGTLTSAVGTPRSWSAV
jgi:hypothetical protein